MSGEVNEIRVAVSGKSIYLAVKNYIKDSETLQRKIEEVLASALDAQGKSGIKQMIQDKLNSYTSWYWRDEIRQIIRETAMVEVKKQLELLLTEEMMSKLVSNMVFSFKKG